MVRSVTGRLVVLAAATSLLAAACGGATPATDTSPSPSDTTAAPSPSPSAVATGLHVFLVQGDTLVSAYREPLVRGSAVLRAALTELLAGPTAFDRDVGLTTAVPDGTTLRDVSVADGTATVDLDAAYESGGGSLSMTLRLAQVVWTATQFPSVDRVGFRIDGTPVTVFGGEGIVLDHPATRAQFEDVLPAILVESPGVGETVPGGSVTVSGSANVFEAVLFVAVTDWDGRIVAQQRVQATSGTGTRGTFSVTLDAEQPQAGVGAVHAWSLSPKDGSRINVVELPVHVAP